MKKTCIYLTVLAFLGLVLLSIFAPSLMPSNNAQFEAKYIPATILVLLLLFSPMVLIFSYIANSMKEKKKAKEVKRLQEQIRIMEEGLSKAEESLEDVDEYFKKLEQ
jgi:pilus assembly protein TadC